MLFKGSSSDYVNVCVHVCVHMCKGALYTCIDVCMNLYLFIYRQGIPRWLSGKESTANAGDADSVPCWEDPLEKEMATHSSILAWIIHGQRSLEG